MPSPTATEITREAKLSAGGTGVTKARWLAMTSRASPLERRARTEARSPKQRFLGATGR